MCLDVTSGSTLRVLPSVVGGTWRSMIHASSFHTSDGNRSVHDRSSFLTCRSPFLFPELVRQAFVFNASDGVTPTRGSVAAIKQRVSNCCQLIFATVINEQVAFSVVSNDSMSPNRFHSPPSNTLSRRIISSIIVAFLLLKRESVFGGGGESRTPVSV